MKNVLLLCLSIVKTDEKYNEYVYELNGKEVELNGYMTNEAPTKAVIRKLKEQGQHLDKIVMLCTHAVLNAEVKHESKDLILDMQLEKYTKEELLELGFQEENDRKLYKLEKYTHVDFYKEKVNQYAKTMDSYYEEHPIEYAVVNMPNIAKDYELTESSLAAAEQVTLSKDKIQLYIDFNGGPRTVPFMILAVSNLMKLRDVKIQEIMTMKYEKPKTRIQNMMPVFESFDLVTGINEYIRYGYIEGLKTYFQNSQSQEIRDILKEMEKFANNLQLCRTENIMKEKGNLWELLDGYTKKYQNIDDRTDSKEQDTYKQLFLYVLNDIMEGCRNILNGELPDIIKWCVERGFVQQALTFCSEELPKYFWDKGIYYGTDIEKRAYEHFLKHPPLTKYNKKNEEYKVFISSEYQAGRDSDSRKAYNWLIKFLMHITEDTKHKEFLKDFPDESYKKKIMIDESNDKRCKDLVKKESNKHIQITAKKALKTFSLDKKGEEESATKAESCLINADRNAAQLLYWKAEERGLSNVKDDDLLHEILVTYFLLKEQRNISNHASNDPKAWSYNYLCYVMTQMSNVLGAIK